MATLKQEIVDSTEKYGGVIVARSIYVSSLLDPVNAGLPSE